MYCWGKREMPRGKPVSAIADMAVFSSAGADRLRSHADLKTTSSAIFGTPQIIK
jgi:hypothetical protein